MCLNFEAHARIVSLWRAKFSVKDIVELRLAEGGVQVSIYMQSDKQT